PLPLFALEPDLAVMLLDNYCVRHRQSLAGALSCASCREEWFKDFFTILFWNADTGIADANLDEFAGDARRDPQGSLRSAASVRLRNRSRRIDDEIQQHLMDFTGQTQQRGQPRIK